MKLIGISILIFIAALSASFPISIYNHVKLLEMKKDKIDELCSKSPAILIYKKDMWDIWVSEREYFIKKNSLEFLNKTDNRPYHTISLF